MILRFILFFLLTSASILRAQDASHADANLEFTRDIVQHYHFHAIVNFKTPKGEAIQFQYDRYPKDGTYEGAERIKADEGVFARREGGVWLQSNDWAETGEPAETTIIPVLKTYVDIANAPLQEPQNQDLSQGKNVWKFIEKRENKGDIYYTYERTREHPHPNGVYPQYTFLKAAHDIDGKLFCVMATGQIRSGGDHLPFVAHYIYLVPMPPGTQVKVYDQATNKVKYQTLTDKDSGWEITAERSAPPTPESPVSLDTHTTIQDVTPSPDASTNAASAPKLGD